MKRLLVRTGYPIGFAVGLLLGPWIAWKNRAVHIDTFTRVQLGSKALVVERVSYDINGAHFDCITEDEFNRKYRR